LKWLTAICKGKLTAKSAEIREFKKNKNETFYDFIKDDKLKKGEVL